MKEIFANVLRAIPAAEGVRKLAPGAGEEFDIAGARLTWKVKGEESGYAFSIAEQALGPGEGVPLHRHPYAEAFYVLQGQVDFFRLLSGKEDWVRCEAGATVIVPSNAPHAFYNKTSEPGRVLGISSHLHQAFFDAVAAADKRKSFAALPLAEAMDRVAQIASGHALQFIPYDVNADDRGQK
jgi:quercetin dioxygenase-like cupin family protein